MKYSCDSLSGLWPPTDVRFNIGGKKNSGGLGGIP